MEWIIADKKPEGTWTKHEWQKHLSEDVLFCNDLAIFVGRWNREQEEWETDEPAARNWVSDVTHWMPLPKNPNH